MAAKKKKKKKKKPARKTSRPVTKARKHKAKPKSKRKPDYVITIELGGKVASADRRPHLHSHHSTSGKPDTVAWRNDDDRGRTVLFTFDGWPFVEPPREILVEAGKDSDTFTIYYGAAALNPDGTQKEYRYGIEPTVPGGPGDPVVIPDD